MPVRVSPLNVANDPTIEDRFWAKVDMGDWSDCWTWGAAKVNGYGRVRCNGRSTLAHRVAYVLLVGEPPSGLVLDHLCRNPSCVNPLHLEPVSNAENIRRGEWSAGAAAIRAARTHCPNGHPFDETNTYVPPATSRKQRQCRACRLAAKRRYNSKVRGNV